MIVVSRRLLQQVNVVSVLSPSPLDAALTKVSCRTRTNPAFVMEGASGG